MRLTLLARCGLETLHGGQIVVSFAAFIADLGDHPMHDSTIM